VEPLVFGLVAASSLFHVAWNGLLKTTGDPLRTATVGLAVAALVIGPAAAAAWWSAGATPIPAAAVGLAVLSGALETLYLVLLVNAYRRADLSVVYPVARGSATLFAVIAGTVVLGERLGALGWLGVGALVMGLLWLRPPWPAIRAVVAARRRAIGVDAPIGPRKPDETRTAVGLALATGLVIATYSAVDRVGVRLVDPWLYAGLLWASMATLLVLLLALGRRSRRLAAVISRPGAPRVEPGRAAVGGLLILAAYLMVLVALSLAPLTAVAPLRESAVALATAFGAIRLRETAGRRATAGRLGAAVVIVAGAMFLALDG
jgi:drug/metabolite transporter (DMT)-like permease